MNPPMKTRNADPWTADAITKSWIPVLVVVLLLMAITFLAKGSKSPVILEPAVRNAAGYYTLLPDEDIECFAESGETLYAGGKSGLYLLDRNTFSPIRHLDFSGKLSFVRSIHFDKDGTLWVGSLQGVLQYNPSSGQETWWSTRNGLPDNRVNTLYSDCFGRLWVGTWGGVAWLDEAGWHVWKKADGLASDMVNVIREDGLGGMWFGAYNVPDGVISILPDFSRFTGDSAGTGKAWNLSEKLRPLADRNRSPELPTPLQWDYLTVVDGIPHSCITDLLRVSPGNMWVGSGFLEGGGACQVEFVHGSWLVTAVYHKDAETGTSSQEEASLLVDGRTIPLYGGLIGEKVRSLFLDSQNRIWLGSEYDGGSILSTSKDTGSVSSFHEESDSSGKNLPEGMNMTWLTTGNGLCNAEIKRVHEDGNGSFWLATRSGITVIPDFSHISQ